MSDFFTTKGEVCLFLGKNGKNTVFSRIKGANKTMEMVLGEKQLKTDNGVLEGKGIETETVEADKMYYTKNGLKTTGWTEAMIKELLGEADLHYPQQCGRMRPRYYYLASTVDAIEKTKAFKERKRAKAAR